MRALFVGDGKHDVGAPDGPHPANSPWPARGVVPILARKVIPGLVLDDSLSLRWANLDRFSPEVGGGARKSRRALVAQGYEGKIPLAALRASACGLEAVIAVVDGDRDAPARSADMAQAAADLRLPVACGVAIESIEAWTLGAASALAETLGLPLDELRRRYPRLPIESLYEGSGRAEHQPKLLLDALAKLGHRHDGLDLREEVAERTDIAELERTCPAGFAAFAEALRRRLDAPP